MVEKRIDSDLEYELGLNYTISPSVKADCYRKDT